MADPRWLTDDEQRAWQGLLAVVNRAFPQFNRTLRDHGLLTVHYLVLAKLSEAPERSLRLNELAAEANLSPSRLTHRLGALIDSGDVIIRPDADDGRVKHAVLTDAGFERLASLAPIHVAEVHHLLFDGLTAEQVEALADAMGAIETRLRDGAAAELG